MLSTYTLVSNLCKTFVNNSSSNIKLSKPQLHKIRQSRGVLGRLLGRLLRTSLTLIQNELIALAKKDLIPLGLTAASATDASAYKKNFVSDCPSDTPLRTKTSIIWNEEMNDIMKIVKSLEETSLSITGVSETTQNQTK